MTCLRSVLRLCNREPHFFHSQLNSGYFTSGGFRLEILVLAVPEEVVTASRGYLQPTGSPFLLAIGLPLVTIAR